MLFRIGISSVMDSGFEDWLFHELEQREITPHNMVLLVYADEIVSYGSDIVRFSTALRSQGIQFGVLNVNYDANHLQVACDVGASIVRVSPNVVNDVLMSHTRKGTYESETRESVRLRDLLSSFRGRGIETVLFSNQDEAIPELVKLNANLGATFIQTPVGMIEETREAAPNTIQQ
jgi:EAL domain-containing protein (putative c-di-GMP-specific phosphodiesterase class I)